MREQSQGPGEPAHAGGRDERLALNEGLFRAANERAAGWEERHQHDGVELYQCECSDLKCREKVRLSCADYERVRAVSTHFFIAPGHDVPDVERVVESHPGWAVVEKDPETHAIAEETDPRAP